MRQEDLNDLVLDLYLSEKQADILGSRLQRWNILHHDIEICFNKNLQN